MSWKVLGVATKDNPYGNEGSIVLISTANDYENAKTILLDFVASKRQHWYKEEFALLSDKSEMRRFIIQQQAQFVLVPRADK